MNAATTPIPESWFVSPPRLLVVGDGLYCSALARILGAAVLAPDDLIVAPEPNELGAYPLVLGELEKIFLVSGASHSAADLLRMHDALWQWMMRLSRLKEEHDLAILFLLQPGGDGLGLELAAGLGIESFETSPRGHGLARMDDSLTSLMVKASAILPQDLPPLRARLEADVRHTALKELKQSLRFTDEEVGAAARRVAATFQGKEYLLDLFCRPPSHRNGSSLRKWLNRVVTEGVTPFIIAGLDEGPTDWLDENRFP